MEEIRQAHALFRRAWSESRSHALSKWEPRPTARHWGDVWEANGIAYESAAALSARVDRLLEVLFRDYLGPSNDDFLAGESGAVNNVIAFLSADVPAFRCGYAKEDYLRRLKSVPLSREHEARLREYALGLCRLPPHRREIGEAGRLMIRLADPEFVARLRVLAADPNERVAKKSEKMLRVVANGRTDLR